MSIPEGATHKAVGPRIDCWYKNINCLGFEFMNQGGSEWIKRDGMPNWPYERIANEQPKQWSGPEDGLPPVGTECEWKYGESSTWKATKILYIGSVYVIVPAHDGEQHYYVQHMQFRAIKTPDQIAAEKRETAIREIMDVADVDCRVTAARLVDAGFKREVV